MNSVLDFYAMQEPTVQQTIDIFKEQWSSKLPGQIQSGSLDLFEVERVMWPHRMFDITGKSILELGPLEGGQTFALHKLGARTITAIEGNSHAFLKCLIVKELYNLGRANFLYGDIIKYLETTNATFDIIFASGVLYHMTEPLKLLWLIKHHTNRCYIWTHYYDQEILRDIYGDKFSARFGEPIFVSQAGYSCQAYVQYYGEALDWQGYCGGNAPSSLWLTRKDILNYLEYLGFKNIEINNEVLHKREPCFSISAQLC